MSEESPWSRPPGGPELSGEAALLAHEHEDVDAALEAFVSGGSDIAAAGEAALEAVGELKRHIYSEEEFLFGPLVAAGLVMPIAVMRREHIDLWRCCDDLAELVAAGSVEQAREAARQLLGKLAEHNLKEERVVYTAAETVLTAEQKRRLHESLTQELPVGWTCVTS